MATPLTLALLAASLLQGASRPVETAPRIREVSVGNGAVLHFVERGSGIPVVFVHGSLSFGGYWNEELGPFARAGFRALAYSRRYDSPNRNPIRPGYSAIADAEDLEGLITRLHLGKVVIVGHSYGALAALFLAIRHPERVRALVLAEAPAVSLLAHLPGHEGPVGRATLSDIERRMVRPMERAFREGHDEEGVRAFMAYVFDDPDAWDKMSPSSRRETMKNVAEWEAMMTTGTLFPNLSPRAVQRIRIPTLILSGENSYPFMKLIDGELLRLLPDARHVVIPGATHQMWIEKPELCRSAVFDFLRRVAGTTPAR